MNKIYLEKVKMLESDPEQTIAYNSKGSIVIKAGPGSGKTNVLTLKMAKLLKEKIKFPRKVACITFSNEATKEIKARVQQLVDYDENNSFIGTIHSFCLSQILKPYTRIFEYGINKDFKIISKEDKRKWIEEIKEELSISSDNLSHTEVDKERMCMMEGESQVIIEVYDIALQVARAYEEKLLRHNMVDFISMVKIATKMIQNEPYLRECLEAKFPYVLIDEYQDLGKPLHEMVLALIHKTNIKIIVVGDPNQTIYGFNGAIPAYLLELENIDKFDSVELKNNYRSHQKILDISSNTMNLPEGFFNAKMKMEKEPEINFIKFRGNHIDQYEYISNEIIPACLKNGIKYSDIAILIRAKKKVKECQKILEQNSIPHYVMVFDFNRGNFIRFLEDCASWILNNRKIYFKDLLNEWVTFKYEGEITNKIIDEERVFLYLTLVSSKEHTSNLLEWIKFIYSKLNIKEAIVSSSMHIDDANDLKSFVKFIREDKEKLDIEKFSKLGVQGDSVSLLTMHSSKGLEYDVVIMPAMEEGTFPSFNKVKEAEIEEEKRTFFVSLTRAKSICYFLMSKSLYGYSKDPSRFIKDINFTSVKDV
ncbi:AAA family ATPase [Bacillus megaterium]|uniref:ATP-dependent helicase n=1 Tax=Priestia megaterium TaxID=1404 RepID=UPI001293BE5A|nr:ATP-dependent helicase [Priestia megaterium]MQR85938.1 AAA family ATPase [Priestia megaterium]